MSKYEVTTLTGTFTVDAESEEQARLLGKDGGRVVLRIAELDENAVGEFVADVDPEGQSFDATRPDAAIIESPASDFGDEEIVVVRRADWDRAVGLARLNDESYQPGEATPIDNHDVQGPRPTYRDPTAAVEVSEHTDAPGLPTPPTDRAGEAFENAGGESYDPATRLDAARAALADDPDGPTDFVPADDVPGDASDAETVEGEYRLTDGDPAPPTTYGGRRDPHDRT